MKKNLGNTDKLIRIILAIVFAALYFTGYVTGAIGIILLVAGGVILLTGVVGNCPIYSLFGFNSCPGKKAM